MFSFELYSVNVLVTAPLENIMAMFDTRDIPYGSSPDRTTTGHRKPGTQQGLGNTDSPVHCKAVNPDLQQQPLPAHSRTRELRGTEHEWVLCTTL